MKTKALPAPAGHDKLVAGPRSPRADRHPEEPAAERFGTRIEPPDDVPMKGLDHR